MTAAQQHDTQAAALAFHDAGCSVVRVATDGTKARLLAKVEIAETGCWLWTGAVNWAGYGTFSLDGRKVYAHRAAWLLLVGPLRDDQQLDHLCRVRRCVRIACLEPVDCRTNLLRGDTLAAANAAKTHCPAGHPYDEQNTQLKRGGRARACRACNRLACAARRAGGRA